MTEQSKHQTNVFHVTDLDDPRLDDYRDIKDRDLLGRDGFPGLFVGEQPLIVEKLLAKAGATKSVLLLPQWLDRLAPLAGEDVPIYVAPADLLEKVAGYRVHRGALAMGYRDKIERTDLSSVLSNDQQPLTLLLCQDITNIDNIGLLFRNAAAFGVDGVLLSSSCHDPLYRKSLRVAIGHTLNVPFARSSDWLGDLEQLSKKWSITLIAAATTNQAVELDCIERPRRVGLILGSEFSGLPATTLDKCDHIAKVPMAENVDSLNVAVAAAVCLHRFSTGKRM